MAEHESALIEAMRRNPEAAVDPAITSSDEAAAGVEPMVPPLDRGAMTHFLMVQAMLTAEERAVARAAAKELSPAELRSWLEAQSKLSVDAAAARVRALIGARGGAA